MKYKLLFITLMATVLTVLTSCSSDEPGVQPVPAPTPDPEPDVTYPLLPGSITRSGSQPWSASEIGNIRIFLTRDEDATYYEGMFQYDAENDKWRSAASVKAEEYHVYGFMPVGVSAVSIGKTASSTDFITGAVLNFSEL